MLLLDRYFLSVPALEKLNKLNSADGHLLHILTKAKMSCVTYTKPIHKKGKGRPCKKGDSIKLKELFESAKDKFTESKIELYGKEEAVQYLCINLLWGQKLYQELRFVLVKYKERNAILVTTKLDFEPEKIIRLYSYRFKIECTFRELRQLIGGFSYQFWCNNMPKLNNYTKKHQPQLVERITSKEVQKKILSTLDAIEGYVMFTSIAMGLLQIISLKFSKDINTRTFRFLRTKSKTVVSEATVACYLRKSIFSVIEKYNRFSISRIIKEKQVDPFFHEDRLAS
ncbi:transposase [Oceanirhabdus sp. W0125-5]|uniref:transposase n=1 Tax=Oceanirhabdus sp. W0125-5 TaxID=2999116 RepID=UPI0022F33ACE|nr:transposase [Oceanirhabdus sp. W0125-5]WBW99491.1 transposase [Oceanirhabdus sp. W0125-5]